MDESSLSSHFDTTAPNMKQDVQEELHQYLKEKELNTLFVSIVESILLEKPDEPIAFIVKFLKVRRMALFRFVDLMMHSFPMVFPSVFRTSSPQKRIRYFDALWNNKCKFRR